MPPVILKRASVLQGYSRDLVAADNTKAIVSITSQALVALFQVPVVVMLVSEDIIVRNILAQVLDRQHVRARRDARPAS